MPWLQLSVFEFFLECLPQGRRLAGPQSAVRTTLTHQEVVSMRAAQTYLDQLHTPHVLSGPGARLFQHFV